jgi:hypothetical protein
MTVRKIGQQLSGISQAIHPAVTKSIATKRQFRSVQNIAHLVLFYFVCGATYFTEESSDSAASFSISNRPMINFDDCGSRITSKPRRLSSAIVSADLFVSQICISALPSRMNLASSALCGSCLFFRRSITATIDGCSFVNNCWRLRSSGEEDLDSLTASAGLDAPPADPPTTPP